jgi:hypothetical protein
VKHVIDVIEIQQKKSPDDNTTAKYTKRQMKDNCSRQVKLSPKKLAGGVAGATSFQASIKTRIKSQFRRRACKQLGR